MVRVEITKDNGVPVSSEDVLLKIDTHYCKSWLRDIDVGNDQLRIPYNRLYGKFFRWGSDSASGDDGCLEQVIDS